MIQANSNSINLFFYNWLIMEINPVVDFLSLLTDDTCGKSLPKHSHLLAERWPVWPGKIPSSFL